MSLNFTEYDKCFNIEFPYISKSIGFLNDITTYTETLANDKIKRDDTNYTSNYKCVLNTVNFADKFTIRSLSGDIKQPEVGMMFLKTYMKQLIGDTLSYENLYQVFNKNQELIELPYPVILYLGGLSYFNKYDNYKNIKTQTDDEMFLNTNNVKDDLSGKDIYSSPDLSRNNAKLIKSIDVETLFMPSTRILNRSILNATASNYVVGDKNILINHRNTMPVIGFGIQNQFLNYYNNYMFGDWFNTDEPNSGRLHVLPGAYNGIVKPLKTYDSYLMEFTALYRNLSITNINYPIDALVNELDSKTIKLKNRTHLDFKSDIISCFITYSKLKAIFMSGKINSKTDLGFYIEKLCTVNNLNFNAKSDFYCLIINFFFSGFRNFDNTLDSEDKYVLRNRFNLSANDLKLTQKEFLNSEIYDMLIGARTINEEVHNLTETLFYIWSLEKSNLLSKYNPVDSKAVYALYPSSGGDITPNALITNPYNSDKSVWKANFNETSMIGAGDINYLKKTTTAQHTTDLSRQVKIFGSKDNTPIINVKPDTLIDVELLPSNRVNGKNRGADIFDTHSSQINPFSNNPLESCYIFDKEFDNNRYSTEYNIDSGSILKNTTRFLWFDSTNHGDLLKEDYTPTAKEWVNIYYRELNGVDTSISYPQNLISNLNIDNTLFAYNYFKTNKLSINSGDTMFKSVITDNDFMEQYKFANLMDSLDFEKLEAFEKLFIEFSSTGLDTTMSASAYNLRNLMLASTVLRYDDMDNLIDPLDPTKVLLTVEQINLCLIGNSMHQYEFMSECGLSKLLNIALTNAQEKRVTDVISEFCGTNITVANFSPLTSIEYPGAPTASLHNLVTTPVVFLSDKSNYSSLAADFNVSGDDINLTRYFSRKMLFGDQYIPNFRELDADEMFELRNLCITYIQNKLYTKNKLDETDLYNTYTLIVINFFKTINIKYTKYNFKQLIRVIRSYVFYILNNVGGGLINADMLPGNPIKSKSDIENIFNPPKAQIKTTPDDNIFKGVKFGGMQL